MDDEGAWSKAKPVQGSPLSNPADLSINTAGDTYAGRREQHRVLRQPDGLERVTEWAAP